MAAVKFRIRPKQNPEKPTAIHCNYYHEGIEIELSTGLKVLPASWANSRVTTPKNKINKLLADKEAALLNLHIDHHGKSKAELESLARSIIKGVPIGEVKEEKKTVVQAVQQFIAQYEREKDAGTVKRYRVLLKKLVSFRPGLTFDQLDHNFYTAFKNYLYDTPNPLYSKFHLEYDNSNVYTLVPSLPSSNTNTPIGLFDEVVFKYFVNLKTICKWAERRGFTPHPAYKEWEILKRDYPPITLSMDELNSLESLDLPKHLDVARDYLVLESRTGQRISDLKRLSRTNIDTGNLWTFAQKKGSRMKTKIIELPLDEDYTRPALVILQKYNYELPKISEQKLNINIKEACRIAGITQDMFIERWAGNKKIRIPGKKYEFISTHTGKKSFITILAGEGVPVSILSALTGTSQRTIEKHYLGRIDIKNIKSHLSKGKSVIMKKAI